MRKIAPVLAIVLAIPALGCPLRPRDEETDSGADSTTSPAPAASETGPSADPGTEPPPGQALSCEDELAKIKAELAECMATH